MFVAARTLFALAAISFFASCAQTPRPNASPSGSPRLAGPLSPSPRLIVGRIIAVDPARAFAFVELVSDFPPAATAAGTELTTRTLDLRETATLRASRYVRGRTLGTTILAGKPSAGDEVVWLAP